MAEPALEELRVKGRRGAQITGTREDHRGQKSNSTGQGVLEKRTLTGATCVCLAHA